MTRKQKKNILRIGIAFVLFIAVCLLPVNGIAKLIAFIIPYLVIGYDVLYGAIRKIIRGQLFDEEFLMSLATFGAFALSEYPEAVAVMLFYQVGEWFQSIAVGKSRRSIAALMDIRPDTANVLRNGEWETVSPEDVLTGETIEIRPGERVPLDGEIISGSTSVDTSALTGESLPRDLHPGNRITSGIINLTGVIRVKTSSTFENSAVNRILELVENASAKKARIEGFITRFSRIYTPIVVLLALIIAFLPPLLFSLSFSEWIRRALIFLVVSCPCALVVSVPLSFFGGIGGASRNGILIKSSNDLEMLSKIKAIVFDKTGTLTKGVFTVSGIHPVGIREDELLEIAALAESRSTHPISKSILSAYGKPVDTDRITGITEKSGHGVVCEIDGKTVLAGNRRHMLDNGIQLDESADGVNAVVHIAFDKSYLGCIEISDSIKEGAAETIKNLKKRGISKTVMLTGDRESAAKRVQSECGIDACFAELLPEDKVSKIETLLSPKAPLAFVGDGINDAPALARADIGIAMGAMGSDAAIEAADVVLMDDSLSKLPTALFIAKKTMRLVKQNIALAIGVKVAVMLAGALGYANMWLAIFADVGVLVLAILNAMRAITKK